MTIAMYMIVAVMCLVCGLRYVRSEMYSDPETANFEDEGYYPMLRSHWVKLRRMSPMVRNQISIPIPRAGKRSDATLDPQFQAQPDEYQYPDFDPEAIAMRNKKLFLRSYGKSPAASWPMRQYFNV